MSLASARIHEVEDDLLAAIDYCYEQGWTDGLPVVPPDVARVEAMLLFEGRPPETVLASHPATGLECTVHAAAVNAVMAGCKSASAAKPAGAVARRKRANIFFIFS